MSHVTTCTAVPIKDELALRLAIDELIREGAPLELRENCIAGMYSREQEKQHPLVIKIKGSPYDVGFSRNSAGELLAEFDPWAGHIGKVLGSRNAASKSPTKAIGRLMEAYTKHAGLRIASAKGGRTTQSRNAVGQLVLTVNY